jgi:hypothetical protein
VSSSAALPSHVTDTLSVKMNKQNQVSSSSVHFSKPSKKALSSSSAALPSYVTDKAPAKKQQ